MGKKTGRRAVPTKFGLTIPEIVDKYGVSRGQIDRALKRLNDVQEGASVEVLVKNIKEYTSVGRPRPPGSGSKPKKTGFGYTKLELAERYGASYCRVKRLLEGFGPQTPERLDEFGRRLIEGNKRQEELLKRRKETFAEFLKRKEKTSRATILKEWMQKNDSHIHSLFYIFDMRLRDYKDYEPKDK